MMILASILLSVGAASAISFNIQDDKDGLIPCDKIDIPVVISGNMMSVGPIALDGTYSTANTAFDKIGFNLASGGPVVGVTWTGEDGNPYGSASALVDGATTNPPITGWGSLGTFSNEIGLPTASGIRTPGQVNIYFTGTVATTPNAVGYNVSAHVISVTIPGSTTTSVFFGDGECGGGQQQDIPEFPTIALPVAAILGLAFYFQRRKE